MFLSTLHTIFSQGDFNVEIALTYKSKNSSFDFLINQPFAPTIQLQAAKHHKFTLQLII